MTMHLQILGAVAVGNPELRQMPPPIERRSRVDADGELAVVGEFLKCLHLFRSRDVVNPGDAVLCESRQGESRFRKPLLE